MLGLLCLYYIGKYYYKLAAQYDKKKWLYAILGILSFYAGALIVGVLLGIYIEITGKYELYDVDDWVFELAMFPFCLATCILFYMLLRHLWSRKDVIITLDDWEI